MRSHRTCRLRQPEKRYGKTDRQALRQDASGREDSPAQEHLHGRTVRRGRESRHGEMCRTDSLRNRTLLAVCESEVDERGGAARPRGRRAGLANAQHSQRHPRPVPRGGALGNQHPGRHHLSPADRAGLFVQSRTRGAQDPADGNRAAQDGRSALALTHGRRLPHPELQQA